MPTDTNRLGRLTLADLNGADLLRNWSQKYGGDAAMSLSVLLAYVNANTTAAAPLVAQYEAPQATGFSVTVATGNTWLILTPGGEYATGTIVLPTGSAGAEVLVNCTQAVTALTVTPASGETVAGEPSALTADGFFRLRFDDVLSRWYRVG